MAEGGEGLREVSAEEILEKIARMEDAEYEGVVVKGDLDVSKLDLPKEDGKSLVRSKIEITRSRIEGTVNFNETIIKESVIFNGTTFSGYIYIYFSAAKFGKDADFRLARFSGNADFGMAIFNGNASFISVAFRGDANFSIATFSGNAFFSSATFSGHTGFSRAKFNEHVDFSSAKFNWRADFSSATFSEDAVFLITTFKRDADFRCAKFSGHVDFRGVNFSGDTFFSHTIFSENADSKMATFGKANFGNAIFNGNADFSSATFNGNADFSGATFNGDTDFSNATFRGDADFKIAILSLDVDFSSATFSGHTGFSRAKFNEHVDFSSAKFNWRADFGSATFSGDAGFSSATFNRDADFSSATFNRDADFRSATFSGDADFRMSRFGNSADFNSKFCRRLALDELKIYSLHLSDAIFEDTSTISLRFCDFTRLDVRWEKIQGKVEYDGSAYLSLVKNFNNLELFNDADECYYEYRTKRRKGHLKGIIPNALDNIAWIAYGYGVRPGYPLALIITLFLISIPIFAIWAEAHKPVNQTIVVNSTIRAFYMSATVLTSNPQSDVLTGYYRLWGVILRIAGWLLMASFLVALAKKALR